MTDSNDILKIDTPENITFDYDVAGIGSRFLAALIDTALLILAQLLLLGLFFLIAALVMDMKVLTSDISSWVIAGISILSFLFFWGYYIFFEILWNGQTPGKRWIGLRVIRMDGTPITASEAIIRNLVRIIDFMPTAYGVGVVTMFINSNSRRVGDLAAGTLVVRDHETKELGDISRARVKASDVWAAKDGLPEGFPIEKLSQDELQIIEEFLTRQWDLSNRRPLAQHILASIVTRLGLSHESIPYPRADEILAAIYKAARMDTTG